MKLLKYKRIISKKNKLSKINIKKYQRIIRIEFKIKK